MGIGKTENKERFMCTGVRQEPLCYRNWNIFPCVVSIGPQNLGSGLWVLVWPLEVRRLLLLWSVHHSNHTTPVQQEQLGGVVVVVVLCVGFTQHWCLCKYMEYFLQCKYTAIYSHSCWNLNLFRVQNTQNFLFQGEMQKFLLLICVLFMLISSDYKRSGCSAAVAYGRAQFSKCK